MNNIEYSVLIPAYNAQKTIRRCLDSLLPQLPENGEVIIVDDGSIDETYSICMDYASKDARIQIYMKQNGGVSSARNVGLDHARGEYVLFVDSDDAVRPDFFQLVQKFTSYHPEFILFHNDSVFSRGQYEFPSNDMKETRKWLSLALRRQLLNSPWSRVFRKDIIDQYNLRFDERLSIGEDKVFVVQYVLNIENVCFVNADIYQVFFDNADSLSRKKRALLEDSVLLEHKLLFEAAEKCGDLSILHAVSYSFYRSAYTVINELRKFSISKKERIQKTRVICEKYCCAKRIRIGSFGDWMLAAPVLMKDAILIDLLLQFKFFGQLTSPKRYQF